MVGAKLVLKSYKQVLTFKGVSSANAVVELMMVPSPFIHQFFFLLRQHQSGKKPQLLYEHLTGGCFRNK